MVDWQVTAVTINCDVIAEEVTIIVKNDWLVKCTGFGKLARSRQTRLELGCKGMQCKQITAYVQKLQAEENQKPGHVGDSK